MNTIFIFIFLLHLLVLGWLVFAYFRSKQREFLYLLGVQCFLPFGYGFIYNLVDVFVIWSQFLQGAIMVIANLIFLLCIYMLSKELLKKYPGKSTKIKKRKDVGA